jgi:Kef-type K+ transport system membrane component KefB
MYSSPIMETGHHEILQFLLLIGTVVILAKVSGGISVQLGQSAVLGELLAGLILGPTLLDLLEWPAFKGAHLDAMMIYLGNFGVILLMFIAGLETNLDEMRKMRSVALTAGSLGAITPILFGFPLAWAFGFPVTTSLFVGIILAATSASITVQTLIEIDRLESREGVALLGSAIVDDVLAILILSFFSAFALSSDGLASVGGVVFRMVLYFALAIGLGFFLLRFGIPLIRRIPVSEPVLAFTLIMVILYSWSAESFGKVAAITGAYIAGVFIAQSDLLHVVEEKIKPITYALFVPIFFISIGLQTNLRLLQWIDLPFAVLLILVAVASKLIGCGGGARLAGMSRIEAMRVGIGMISRGEVGLIVAGIGIQTGLISDAVFAVAVLMIVVTTLITPVMVRWSFAWGEAIPAQDETIFRGEKR